METPSSGGTVQGYDIYARTIYGARASILVGVLATTAVTLFGGFFGMISGYFSGWSDTIISRITDVFFAIPLILGGILFMTGVPQRPVDAVPVGGHEGRDRPLDPCVAGGPPSDARLGAAGEAQRVRPGGSGAGRRPPRILWRHILPNAVTPVLTLTTINVGAFIVAEATLSFLGIGLLPPAVSWGVASTKHCRSSTPTRTCCCSPACSCACVCLRSSCSASACGTRSTPSPDDQPRPTEREADDRAVDSQPADSQPEDPDRRRTPPACRRPAARGAGPARGVPYARRRRQARSTASTST